MGQSVTREDKLASILARLEYLNLGLDEAVADCYINGDFEDDPASIDYSHPETLTDQQAQWLLAYLVDRH
jgi:hypothetical protein